MVTLDEYIEIMRNALGVFRAKWISGNRSNKELYPLALLEGEWDEMFLSELEQERMVKK